MSEKVIDVEPYQVKDNLIKLKIEVSLDAVKDKFKNEQGDKINLFNAELKNGDILTPRKTSSMMEISVKPEWAYHEAKKNLFDLVSPGENPENTVHLAVRAVCYKTFWCTNQVFFDLSEISVRETQFRISMNDIYEQVIIESYIIRKNQFSSPAPRKAFLLNSILCQNDEVYIQTDQLDTVGGNYLPIEAKDLKDLLFQVVADDAHTFPIIYFSKDMEKLFRRNDLHAVNTAFLMIMPALMNYYLRWFIFRCKSDHTSKRQKSLADKIGKLTGVSKDSLFEIMEMEADQKVERYLDLSNKLFVGIQTIGGINFKRELLKFINQEKKLKGEPI